MKTNTDLTIFCKSVNPAARSTEVWTATHVKSVLWEERKAGNVLRSGLIEADRVTVYVPFARELPDLKAGDVLVKGLVFEEINSSFTVTDLKQRYPHSATVRSVDLFDVGSPALWHWEIGGA